MITVGLGVVVDGLGSPMVLVFSCQSHGVGVQLSVPWCGCSAVSPMVWVFSCQSHGVRVQLSVPWCGCSAVSPMVWVFSCQSHGVGVQLSVPWCGCSAVSPMVWVFRPWTGSVAGRCRAHLTIATVIPALLFVGWLDACLTPQLHARRLAG